ncbi:O-antigen ligase family protein [Pseudomonas sp. LRF_L74]|uniref:O-antigen ligase family protein n=1 Tax=Pseudomonas sp. LRF_L74 TaxID=3369422 RepID=UPI003F5E4E8B
MFRQLEVGLEALKRVRMEPVLLVWMSIGLFVQLAGLLFNSDGSRYATQVYLLLFVPALILLIWDRLALSLWRQLPAYCFLVLMAWVLLIAVLHPGSGKSLGYWLKVVLLLGLYVFAVARLVASPRRFQVILIAAALVAVLFACLTLYYQFVVLDRPFEYRILRSGSVRLRELGWKGLADLNHPIIAGLYYGIFVVMITWFFLAWRMTAARTSMLALALVGLLLYVLLTFSRGAWFSVAAGSFVLLLLFSNRKAYVFLVIGLVLLAVATYWFWPEIQNERRIGVTDREFIWHNWLQHLPSFWLWGSGAGAELMFTFPEGTRQAGRTFNHAHSLYLQLWYEYGVIGLVLFLAFMGSLLWKGWRCRHTPLALLALGLLVFAMVAMVSDVYAIFHRPSPYWVLLWLPAGILLGVKWPENHRQPMPSIP